MFESATDLKSAMNENRRIDTSPEQMRIYSTYAFGRMSWDASSTLLRALFRDAMRPSIERDTFTDEYFARSIGRFSTNPPRKFDVIDLDLFWKLN